MLVKEVRIKKEKLCFLINRKHIFYIITIFTKKKSIMKKNNFIVIVMFCKKVMLKIFQYATMRLNMKGVEKRNK